MTFGDLHPYARATDRVSIERLFEADSEVLSMWIAEPYVPLAAPVIEAIESRAGLGWYGYEIRPRETKEAFRSWMSRRHGWHLGDTHLLVSPSVGTSIGAAMELVTEPGETVILQPPVFTDFKPLVTRPHRKVGRNSLVLGNGGYTMDLNALESIAGRQDTTAMILCNPHNPVGRVWTHEELLAVADICSRHNVFVISDEIHADIMLEGSVFTPFAVAAKTSDVRWVALHGPIKTFGLAGVADTLLVTDDSEFAEMFNQMSSRLHLVRNNVFAMAATAAAYEQGEEWLQRLLTDVSRNVETLANGLPDPLRLVRPEGTYLAWIDFRELGVDVPDLARWLAHEARIALSPGHWFGREGAGFARMSIAVPQDVIQEATARLTTAIG
ncbi:MAG: pyridoxal phosphate-dependent aminotransferase [Acidimicrobiia bacterium]|nr:MAG: pyridoxal phosphate-dependent aminotransferase [Acidimicrobiia bacterium]